MFRTVKKGTKPKSIRAAAQDDKSDEEENTLDEKASEVLQLKRKLAKPDQRKRTVVRTVPDEDDSSRRATKKAKKKSLGFGGAPLPKTETNLDRLEAACGRTYDTQYSKDALSQLKSEQQQLPVDDSEKESMESTDDNAVYWDGVKKFQPEIISGEEALKLQEQAKSAGVGDAWPLEDVPDRNKTEFGDHNHDESSAWEAEVTRRAGLSTTDDTPVQPPPSSTSVKHFRMQIASTRSQLLEQRDELERAQQRREAEAAQTRSELERQQNDLNQSGESLEFYQHLRESLAAWVGALRELDEKIKPIQHALHGLESDVAANVRWMEWEDDSITLLREAGMLDEVLGRQPDEAVFDTMVTIDEFGRDFKTQRLMDREKRLKSRRRVSKQRSEAVRGDESDAFLDDEEQEGFRERHVALQKALDVAMQGVEDEYGMLHNLINLFEEWKVNHDDEYRRTYASLSLADLASVLVRSELCSLNDPWNHSDGYKEAKWTTAVHAAFEAGVLDSDSLERLMDKSVVPTVRHFLKKSGYNLVSTKQSRALNRFYLQVQKLLPMNSPAFAKLRQMMTTYVEERLNEIAIPILTKSVWPSLEDDDLKDAFQMATWGQTNRIKKILHNLIFYWSPLLPLDDRDDSDTDAFIELILDFIVNKLLFLLSSLKDVDHPKFAASPADIYGEVWNDLQSTGWLDRPEWMIQSMALRAAATAYGIKVE